VQTSASEEPPLSALDNPLDCGRRLWTPISILSFPSILFIDQQIPNPSRPLCAVHL